MNYRFAIQTLLFSVLVLPFATQAQLISVDVLGVGVDVTVPGAGGGDDDISALSLDVLSEDALLGAGLAGQDILLLGAPSEPLDGLGAGGDALAPLLDNLGGDSSVIEFLQDTAGGNDVVPEVLTIELPEDDPDQAEVDAQGERIDSDRPKKFLGRSAAAAQCRDADRDSVCDEVDRCPNSPAGAIVLPSGCHLDKAKPLELRGVSFATDTALLNASSAAVLRQASRILKSQPHLHVNVEVAGHTDDRGSDDYNMRLAMARALAVINFLVAEGVEATRLHAVGYGEHQPKVDIRGLNTAELTAARAENRRVELRVIDGVDNN
ncbi:OmpA family protein [Spongiibacter sp.]|uniref:OmpA family protein n=1 Tax=Spongiibacter sp. TaxID=2024860 RepID=UPI003565AC98